MNLMEKGAGLLTKKLADSCSVPVEYRRGTDDPLQLSACIGSTLFRTENEYGVTIRERSVDFLVAAPGFIPERGDEIRWDGNKYEVLAPNGEPVWRFSDNFGKSLRIHTKFMGAVDE